MSARGRIEAYYTTEQVAEILRVKPKTVRGWIAAGHLDAVKLHRQWRVRPASVDGMLRPGRDVA